MIRKPEVLERKLHLMLINLVSLIGIREGMQVLDVGCARISLVLTYVKKQRAKYYKMRALNALIVRFHNLHYF
jgi:hypothetical protein